MNPALISRNRHVMADRRVHLLLLAAITFLAAVLRFYRLDAWSFWIDEIFTVRRAQIHILDGSIANFWRQPASLFLVAGALRLFGVSEWSARLAPALIGVLTIPVLYFSIRRMVGSASAVIASLLLAVSPWHIYWSQNARFYTALFLLYLLAYVGFYRSLEEARPSLMGMTLLFLFMAFRERAFALFLVPVALSYLMLLSWKYFESPPGYSRRTILMFLLPLLGYGVYTLLSFAAGDNPPLVDTIRGFWGRPIDDPFRLASFISFDLGIPLICASLLGAWQRFRIRDRAGLYLLAGALVPIFIALALSPFVFVKDRYVFLALPGWIVLAAAAVRNLSASLPDRSNFFALGLLLLLVADAAGDNLLYFTVANGNRRDWRSAFALIAQRRQPADVVVSTWPELGAYYLDDEVQPMNGLAPEQVRQSGRNYWFVADSEAVWVTGAIWPWVINNAELISVSSPRTVEDNTLWVYRYDPRRMVQLGVGDRKLQVELPPSTLFGPESDLISTHWNLRPGDGLLTAVTSGRIQKTMAHVAPVEAGNWLYDGEHARRSQQPPLAILGGSGTGDQPLPMPR